jgi:ABC-type glycerol-3-phosphate transport system permease component
MSSIVSQSVLIACLTVFGAFAGYLIARHSSPGRLRRLLLSLLGSIVGGLISSISSYIMMTYRVPNMVVDWLSQVLGT